MGNKVGTIFQPYLKGQKINIVKFQSECNGMELESKNIFKRINQIVVPRHLKGIKQFESVFNHYVVMESQLFDSEMKKIVKYIKKYNPPSKKNISQVAGFFNKFAQREAHARAPMLKQMKELFKLYNIKIGKPAK